MLSKYPFFVLLSSFSLFNFLFFFILTVSTSLGTVPHTISQEQYWLSTATTLATMITLLSVMAAAVMYVLPALPPLPSSPSLSYPPLLPTPLPRVNLSLSNATVLLVTSSPRPLQAQFKYPSTNPILPTHPCAPRSTLHAPHTTHHTPRAM